MLGRFGRVLLAASFLVVLWAPAAQGRIRDGDPPPGPDACNPGEYSDNGTGTVTNPCLPIPNPPVFPPPGYTGPDFHCWTLVIPNGMYSVDVLAVGAAGSPSQSSGSGGLGDGISTTATGLQNNDRLRICVNTNRGHAGAGEVINGGDGGGASGVALGTTFFTPFLIAGGGGGAGDGNDGGDAGMPDADVGDSNPSAAGGGGGGSNTLGGGPGGAGFNGGGSGTAGASYTAGGTAVGGDGGPGYGAGGGGGSGYKSGGGGGGVGAIGNLAAGGGGGTSFCGDTHVSGELTITNCSRTAGAGTQTSLGSTAGHARVTLAFHAPGQCQPGYYSATGNEPCTPASAGHYVDAASATSQSDCQLGFYQPSSAAVTCLAADIGYYVDSTASATQTACPAGQTTSGTASVSVAACFDADASAPTMGAVSAQLRLGGRVGSASILVEWSASDDVTPPGNLVYEIESRRMKGAGWTPWANNQSVGNNVSVLEIPLWRTQQYRVRAMDNSGKWSAWAESNTIYPIRRNERHFARTGSWQSIASAGAMRGRVAQSSEAGATATLHFTGSGVALVMTTGAGQGVVQVCLDPGTGGESCQQVDLGTFTPTGQRHFVATYPGLTGGLHDLRVAVVSGTINLDGAIVSR